MICQTQYLTVLFLKGTVLLVKPYATIGFHGKMADFSKGKYTNENLNQINFDNNPIYRYLLLIFVKQFS